MTHSLFGSLLMCVTGSASVSATLWTMVSRSEKRTATWTESVKGWTTVWNSGSENLKGLQSAPGFGRQSPMDSESKFQLM